MLPGVNKLLVNVSSNQAPEERSCTIKVTGGGQERTLTVWQLGSTPALKVAPEQFTTLTSDSAVIRFRVITNVPFEVKITEGDEWDFYRWNKLVWIRQLSVLLSGIMGQRTVAVKLW